MARKTTGLIVLLAPRATRDLNEIWDYNAERYDVDHADRYAEFLDQKTAELATRYADGKPVPGRPEYLYLTFRKSIRGHGHVVLFRINDQAVEVARFFHTAQDWQGKVGRGEL